MARAPDDDREDESDSLLCDDVSTTQSARDDATRAISEPNSNSARTSKLGAADEHLLKSDVIINADSPCTDAVAACKTGSSETVADSGSECAAASCQGMGTSETLKANGVCTASDDSVQTTTAAVINSVSNADRKKQQLDLIDEYCKETLRHVLPD